MKRLADLPVRKDWQTTIAAQGLNFWQTTLPSGAVKSYWGEGSAYSFTADEIAEFETVAATLFEMCVVAGDYLLQNPKLLKRMGIPEWTWDEVVRSWNDEPACQSVLGRFDIRYGGQSYVSTWEKSLETPTLLEFNADTPTALPESAIVQWLWHEDTGIGSDQWNSIFERLVEAWRRNLGILEERLGHKPFVHFGCTNADPSGEDIANLLLIERTCAEAGYETAHLFMEDIVRGEDLRFYDAEGPDRRHIEVLFKLHPWEFVVADAFGRDAFRDMAQPNGTRWIEAPYKLLWSNKAILPVLWKIYGDDEDRSRYLIPSYFPEERPSWMRDYVMKPLLGREGASISVFRDDQEVQHQPGVYGEEGFVCQAYRELPNFPDADGPHHPVLGWWMVDGEPVGMGIRESDGPITDNLSTFVPHVIE